MPWLVAYLMLLHLAWVMWFVRKYFTLNYVIYISSKVLTFTTFLVQKLHGVKIDPYCALNVCVLYCADEVYTGFNHDNSLVKFVFLNSMYTVSRIEQNIRYLVYNF